VDQKRVQHAVPTEVGAIAGVVDEVETPAESNSGVVGVKVAVPGCWVTLFWGESEVPAEALFVIFALLASFAFCFSVAFAVFAFLAFSLSLASPKVKRTRERSQKRKTPLVKKTEQETRRHTVRSLAKREAGKATPLVIRSREARSEPASRFARDQRFRITEGEARPLLALREIFGKAKATPSVTRALHQRFRITEGKARPLLAL